MPRRWFAHIALAIASLSAMAPALAASPAPTACPPQPTPPGREFLLRAREQAADRGVLWRISQGGRDSYVYGSLHAGRAEWFALGPRLEAALHRTGVLALELNVVDPAVLAGLQAVQAAPPRALPDGVMRSLRAAWLAECLPEADLARGAAEWQVTQVAVARAQRQGLFALYGAESVLLMNSLHAQRPVVGLETLETQLSALLARDDAEAAAMVADGLAELQRPQAAALLERLARAWARNDLADLENYPQWCDCVNTPAEREGFARLIGGRNPGMADAIQRLHAGVSVFAAVGALHLVGPQGLPALLRARGFTVTRVF